MKRQVGAIGEKKQRAVGDWVPKLNVQSPKLLPLDRPLPLCLTWLQEQPTNKKEGGCKQLDNVQGREIAIGKRRDRAIGNAKQPGGNAEKPDASLQIS